MKKTIKKLIVMLVVMALLVLDFPLGGSDSGAGKLLFNVLNTGVEQVKADSESSYSFIIGNKEVNDGQTIDYSLYNNADKTLTIILRSTDGIPDGTKITWVVSNSNIITVKTQDDATCSVTLDIISPGFSGLSVTMLTPDGTTYTAAAYCAIYVPLQWSDNVSSTDPTMNNIVADSANGNYGLFYAQTGEKQYSLQLYTSDSPDHPNQDHYIRKLKYVSYKYSAASGKTGNVTSDAKADEIGDFTAALSWSSSDPSVATVDSLTGLVTAVSAGFATISVKTSTENERQGEGDELSYNVLVVPEGHVAGYTTDNKSEDKIVTSGRDDELVIQTNATHASTLSWRVFKGDYATKNNDITEQMKSHMEIGEANGRVVLKDLSAGVYYVTAIPVKDAAASRIFNTYDVTQAFVQSLKFIIIVPLTFPQGAIEMSYYNSNIYDSYDIIANTNIPKGLFRYYSNDAQIAKVNLDNGVVDATGVGSTTIKVSLQNEKILKELFGSYADDAASIGYDKNDKLIPVNVHDGIALSQYSATMAAGSDLQLELTAPNPYSGDIVWSTSDASVCSVDESGLVSARKAGSATVSVTIKVGGITRRARCTIKVVSTVDNITLSALKDYVDVGENLTITANATPKSNDTTLKWVCSDPSVAEITSANPLSVTIVGVKPGTVVISAVNADNAILGTKIINVVTKIEGVTLSDEEVTLPKAVGFYQLYAYCTPALPENEKLIWQSSDKKIVTVDDNGRVTFVKPGSAVVSVVTSNGKTAQCKFTILQGVESIALDESSLTMYVGESYRMTYVIKPANASDATLKWTSSDQKIATVDASGYITAKNTGTCVITAQAADGSGIFVPCNVTVLRKASALTIDVTELTLDVNESYLLETELKPADCTDVVKYESSNAKVATVSKKGKITAKSKGTCIIFAKTDSGLSAYCTVNVTQQVTGITLNLNDATINVGDELELIATITPKNATDDDCEWTSSNTAVASVNQAGMVKGLQGGVTMIKCVTTDGDYMAYALITVVEKVTEITVEEEAEIAVGQKLKLNATISNETATDKTVTWKSSKKSVCSVTKKGVIKGKKAGKAIITVKANDGSGAFAECEVKVIRGTEAVNVSAGYVTVEVGQSIKIKATTEPEKTTYNPVWSSDDPETAIVNKKGKITGIKVGKCMVRATAPDNPDAFAIVYVVVTEPPEPPKPVPASNIVLSQSDMLMVVGQTDEITYTILPANNDDEIVFASANEGVAMVDSTGKVVARSAGETDIVLTAKKSGKSGTVHVCVIGLSTTNITLHQYEKTKIALKVYGVDPKKVKVSWGTASQSIAEVDQSGNVTGKACGQTYVYAEINGHRLSCNVKVTKNR